MKTGNSLICLTIILCISSCSSPKKNNVVNPEKNIESPSIKTNNVLPDDQNKTAESCKDQPNTPTTKKTTQATKTNEDTNGDIEKDDPKSGIQNIEITLLNLPSGSYSIEDLRTALSQVQIDEGGNLDIYDDQGKIENLSNYTHNSGDVEYTFLATKEGAESLEKKITLNIKKAEEDAVAKKAILIGMDGLQYEKILALTTPNFDRLTVKKAYTGGINGYHSQQATSSGPGWATILTGVWANKHKITSNGSGLASSDYPSIFKRLHDHNANLKQASIQHWGNPNTVYFKNDITSVDRIENGINDESVTNAAIEEIDKGTDFIFIHLDDPDHVGHADGFGNTYNNSIITIDEQLGRILDAIDNAHTNTDQDWLVLVVTDHGRTTSGYGHGGQTTLEKTIFIGTNKNLNAEFTTTSSPSINDFESLYAHPSQASIIPTILYHLDIPVQKEWKLDAPSLLGDIGVRKLMPGTQATLTWRSNSTEDVNIYKNGQLIDTVKANQQQWTDNQHQQAPLADYIVDLNNNPVAYRTQNLQITSAMLWGDNPVYFFRSDEQYVRYNTSTSKADSGYPRLINDSSWTGLDAYKSLIIASFTHNTDTTYFFLSDGRYIAYDIPSDKARDGYPKPIKDDWPGLGSYATKINAALRWKNEDTVFFFIDDGQHLLFNLAEGKVDDGYPTAINNNNWPGLESHAEDITAALKWNDSTAYFFLKNKKYIHYSIIDEKSESGYPKAINSTTWEGLLTP